MKLPDLSRAKARAGDAFVDLSALAGAGAIIHGVDLIYHPAAFVVGGLFALTGAWLTARKGG